MSEPAASASAVPHTPPPPAVSLRAGLWRDNPAFVQLLGLCPLLAVSTSVVNGVALALATALVMLGSSATTAALRRFIPLGVRLPILILIVATFTSAVVMLLEAWAMSLYVALALFIQIIVTNCAILARLEACARRVDVAAALRDALGRALGFGWVLIVLGAVRELLAEGSLACGAERVFGAAAAGWCIDLDGPGSTFLLAATPAGAFITLGLLLALRQAFARDPADAGTQPLRIIESRAAASKHPTGQP